MSSESSDSDNCDSLRRRLRRILGLQGEQGQPGSSIPGGVLLGTYAGTHDHVVYCEAQIPHVSGYGGRPPERTRTLAIRGPHGVVARAFALVLPVLRGQSARVLEI